MLGWEFPPSITGGLGVASEGLARGLLQSGAEVALVLPRLASAAGVRRLTLLDGRTVLTETEPDRGPRGGRRSRARRPPFSPYSPPRVLRREAVRAGRRRSWSAEPYGPDLVSEVLRYAEAAGRIARRERFDVIHAHDWMTYLAGLEARRVSGRPLAVHVHATELDRAGSLDNRFVADIEALGVRLADRVIAVSRYTATRVAEVYGVPPERLSVVHNAIDAGTACHARRGRRPPLVLFAGRVTWQKGPEFFLEAAAIVAQEVKRARFAMAGAGDLLPAAIARAEALGIRRRVLFTGFLPPEELDRLYAEADVFVLSSVSEPFGLAALEALAHGTPAIVPRQAGVSEVVRNVLLVDFGDVEDLAAKILAVLLSPRIARAFAARGRAEVLQLPWKGAAEKCLRVYREILAAPATARRSGTTIPRISRSSSPGA